MTTRAFVVIVFVFGSWGCSGNDTPPTKKPVGTVPVDILSTPLPPLSASTNTDATLFEKLSPSQTGVNFVNSADVTNARKYLYNSPFVTGGVAIGDVSGDGKPDLFLLNGVKGNKLFVQTASFQFEDATKQARLIDTKAWGAGAAMVDIDNDGDLDIYVANYDAPNQLHINDGRGVFTEQAEKFGLAIHDASLMPTFCDYDRDGHVDLYLITNQLFDPNGRPARPPYRMEDGKPVILPEYQKYYAITKRPNGKYEADLCGRPDRLMRNNGNGTFTDVTSHAGIDAKGFGLSAAWFDYDSDGWPDLYVANDYTDPDHLYRNNGDGTFAEVTADTVPYTAWFSMGTDVADINNDGRFDLLTTDMSATTHYKAKVAMGDMDKRIPLIAHLWPPQHMRNCLFVNSGTNRFLEVAYMAGIASTDWTWGVRTSDFDNDGKVDVVVANGAARNFNNSDITITPQMLIGRHAWEYYEDMPLHREQNLAFQNTGDLRFKNISKAWGFDHESVSSGVAQGDFDGDGNLDLVVANVEDPVSIYRNRASKGHRITVRLNGTMSNRLGLGAVVRIKSASGNQVRQMATTTGFLSSSEPVIHFGLGDDTAISELTVEWPSGHQQTFADLKADQAFVITEPSNEPPMPKGKPTQTRTAKVTLFEEVSKSIGLDFTHKEQPYDDFSRQPLLPAKLSQLGPGVAVADVNADGMDDVYVGGAAGAAGSLFISVGDGKFAEQSSRSLELTKKHEAMGVVFLDVNGDGYQDLFIANGSYEFPKNSPLLKNQLFVNDGSGRFVFAPGGALTGDADASSVVVASDFDGDGDLDLFVGGRCVADAYPVTPRSHLLQNNGGKFIDITDAVAPGLSSVGLVTSALWSDVDNDGKPDLLVTTEWGPVHYFHNTGSQLKNKTADAKLGDRKGWWNAITACDVNQDGSMDYVVLNVGRNTKYGRPYPGHPAVLFYGDMESNGSMKVVEAKPGDAGLLPVRGLSCSSQAMPSIRNRFPTFHKFAIANLEDIYTDKCLENALKLSAVEFDSGVLINNGSGQFSWQPLPTSVQVSPGYGVAATDFDADGHVDLAIAQNLFTREPETGLWRGGVGVILRGDGKGTFAPITTDNSGFVVAGDAKGLAIADLDNNGRPDMIVTQNNDRLLAFKNMSSSGQPLAVRLKGKPGNPTAVGARVTVTCSNGSQQTAEIHAGSGYLSQSTATLFFGCEADAKIESLKVRWPDGSRSTHDIESHETRMNIDWP